MKAVILDIDGTLCESPFKNITHNDNDRLRTPAFAQQLRDAEPYDWVKEHDWDQYQFIIVVTGRLSDWNEITASWLEQSGITPKGLYMDAAIHNVGWNDGLPSREASYTDYCGRKILYITKLTCSLLLLGSDVDIYEDDPFVVAELRRVWKFMRRRVHVYLVEGGGL